MMQISNCYFNQDKVFNDDDRCGEEAEDGLALSGFFAWIDGWGEDLWVGSLVKGFDDSLTEKVDEGLDVGAKEGGDDG